MTTPPTPATAPLDIATRPLPPDGLVISVAGELDCSTVGQLEAEVVGPANDPDIERLVLDLSGVTLIDSRGVGLLVSLTRVRREADGTLELAKVSPTVLRILEITMLDRLFTLVDEI